MQLDTTFHVYILTNSHHTVLYTGKTERLDGRIIDHKNRVDPGSFTARYNADKLVYYEECESAEHAKLRERQIKAGSRKKKEELINEMNPQWRDLTEEILKS